jgi:hypothetical protein
MRNRVLSIAPYLSAALVFALLVAAFATAASDNSSTDSRPVIRKVKPMDLKIGDTLVITGKNFREGKLRNTVIFSREGAMSVFVKADEATKTQIKVVVPAKLGPFLKQKKGKGRATRFSLRVLATSVSKKATPASLSPVINPASGTVTDPSIASPDDCDKDGVSNAKDTDDDDDLLSDDLEAKIKTDPCKADTDGDGVEDGYEYYSAIDLNRVNLPYPGKRPYPNALDPSDAGIDHDGDSLTLAEEYAGWVRYGRHQLPLNLSAGSPRTGGGVRDDDRDIDGDGLTNFWEAHGPLSGQTWWTKWYDQEKPYRTANLFLGTDWLDADSDGDGVPDGQDDQDFDGYDNAFEATRDNGYFVNPFNPCIPDPTVDICSPYLDSKADQAWPPFAQGFSKRDQGPLPASAADNSPTPAS